MMFRRHPHRGLGSDLLTAIWGRMGLLVPFAENARGALARTCRELAGLTGANVHRARHTFAMRWTEHRRRSRQKLSRKRQGSFLLAEVSSWSPLQRPLPSLRVHLWLRSKGAPETRNTL